MTEKKTSKILIVDPKASRRDILASRFRLQGFETELANSGFQSLSLVEKDKFSTIIIIGNSSDMSAVELISLLRDRNKKEELQILFVDKKADETEVIEYFRLGINDFIVFNDKVFSSILEKIQKFNQQTLLY